MTNQWQLNWRSWWLLSILCQRRTAHFTVGFTSNGGYRSFGSKIQESLTTPIHHYIYINLSFYQNCNSAAVFGKDYITSPPAGNRPTENGGVFYRIEMRLKNISYLFHNSTISMQCFFSSKKTPFSRHFELNLKIFLFFVFLLHLYF